MAIKLGWRKNEKQETIWYGDPAVDWEATPEEAKKRYLETGDSKALSIKPNEEPPTKFRFWAPTAEQRSTIIGQCIIKPRGANIADVDDMSHDLARIYVLLTRACCEIVSEDPEMRRRTLEFNYIPMIASDVFDRLVEKFGDEFYMKFGTWIEAASRLSEAEKKTS